MKSKEIEVGAKILINNEPYVVIENSFTNIGRGQAFYKVKAKNILNENIITKTIKIGEKLKKADILNLDLKFLYFTENLYYFFDDSTSEYYEINSNLLKDKIKWIQAGCTYSITFWNNNPIEIKLPKFIELKVISSENIKKDHGTHKNFKYVMLENNINMKVPIFIKLNDVIKIDTLSGTYISRVNN